VPEISISIEQVYFKSGRLLLCILWFVWLDTNYLGFIMVSWDTNSNESVFNSFFI